MDELLEEIAMELEEELLEANNCEDCAWNGAIATAISIVQAHISSY